MDEMEIDDGQLIEIVRHFSVLYDIKHKEYRNHEVKTNAWKTIGETMNRPAAECEARWTTLRNVFTRESKKAKVVPSGSGGKGKPWIWLEEMSFLLGFIRRRKTKGNVSKPETDEIEMDTPSEDVWDTMSEIFFDSSQVEPMEKTGEETQDENRDPFEAVEVVCETEEVPAKKKKSNDDPIVPVVHLKTLHTHP
ncbi:unnamed protein product [Phaedon cochleariae]|uniref:MADF domain-containing protein n=1 Tax=Phaedon cochleariae TaxID=80249 RepID=A0A9N9SHF5_PHACE|nr:unnamed protein product [Phaedon cochleariae]